MSLFSPAQLVGYIALILGVTAFRQKTDRRLKLFSATQCVFYAVHFLLLRNLPASASSSISGVRSFLALKTRSRLLAAVFIIINLGAGFIFAKNGAGWLTIIASCAGTYAMFAMKGVPMRAVLLACTLLWLTNNILSRSIGGTLLESTIAITNISTMFRMVRPSSDEPLTPALPSEL
jgi:hypothetical protein